VLLGLFLTLPAAPATVTAADDGITLTVATGAAPGGVNLSWSSGPGGPYTMYRSTAGPPGITSANALGTTPGATWTDTPPAAPIVYYAVTQAPFWTRDVSTAPLAPQSGTMIANLVAAGGFGNGRLQIDFSITVLTADASVPLQSFQPTSDFYTPDCDLQPVPVPPGGALEGESGYACTGGGDCHLLVKHLQANRLYEMWRADISGGVFHGGCLAIWDMSRIYPPSGRGEQCTSADAAGMPIVPLLFTADELQAGAINHAIRFILPNARIQAGVYVHPATHAGAPSGQGMPPYGSRLRLRGDFPLASLPSEGARVIARALQRYGMILADGGTIALTAASDRFTAAKWSAVLPGGSTSLAAIQPADFVVLDGGAPIPLTYDCVRNP
jgi:serine/threonine-protein kinase